MKSLLFALLLAPFLAGAQPSTLKVGLASADITPETPIWLSGYAVRQKPAAGVIQPLHAKALAVEDGQGSNVVIVTVEVLGLSKEIVDEVRAKAAGGAEQNHTRILFNSTHTHTGPVIWPCLDVVYELAPDDQRQIAAYRQKLTGLLVGIIDSALARMSPARLYFGRGSAGFAINRRGAINPNGPIDHEVPVVKVTSPTGQLRAILFGYACHNTTIEDEFQYVNGDYSGYAMEELEKANPGVTALFMIGCAGDQNPEPRGKLAQAKDHGAELARSVASVLQTPMTEVRGPIRSARTDFDLPFAPVDPLVYQKDILGDNIYKQRRAKLMLQAYNKGWKVDAYKYPVQVIRFGKDLTILGMADEVVVDYALWNKKRYPKENLFVAGYCNQVNCYIPTKRLLKEGGYEPDESMIYYGFPGSYKPEVEDIIMQKIDFLMKAVGVK